MPFWRTALTLAVGGGMVETFAFGGKAPSEEAQLGGGGKNGRVGVPAPSEPFSLAEMVGISSYAPAGALSSRVITSQWLSVRTEALFEAKWTHFTSFTPRFCRKNTYFKDPKQA